MTIFEIDKAIEELILSSLDEETGEVTIDEEALSELQMARDTKVENLALFVKNARATAKAMRDEEIALATRRKREEAAADRAEQYLELVLNGETFKSPRVAVGHRKSTSLKLADGFLAWAKANAIGLLRERDPEPDKRAISDAIKAGADVPFADLVTSTSLTIK